MAEIVNMPKLGFDMAEAPWCVGSPGRRRGSQGQCLAEIETDKATVEVESGFSGVVLRHLIKEGTPVPVGDPIAVIGQEGESVDLDSLGVSASAEAPSAAAPVEAPAEAVSAATQAPVAAASAAAEEAPVAEAIPGLPDGVRASPLARRMAEDLGIDLRRIKGSGPQGRIVKQDIEQFQAQPAPVMPCGYSDSQRLPKRAATGI